MSISQKKIEQHIKLYYPNIIFNYYDIKIEEDIIKIKTNNRTNGVNKIKNPLYNYIEEKYFMKCVTGDTIYHFLPLKYVFTILKEKKIRLYNLNKYLKDDPAEFSCFLERLGIILPKPEKQINQIKENIFVFSCTTDNISDKHWQRFGKTEKIVCLKLKINFSDQDDYTLDIRKVAYEKGLLKLFSLQESIFEKYNKRLEIRGWSCFAKFMKQDYFDWEKEIRLCYNKNVQPICNVSGMPCSNQHVYCDKGVSYIKMPLKNSYFELKIEEVQVRKDNWQSDLKSFCKNESLNCKIVKIK